MAIIKLIVNNKVLNEVHGMDWVLNRWVVAEKALLIRGKNKRFKMKPDQNILLALPVEYKDRLIGNRILTLDATFVAQDNPDYFKDKNEALRKLSSYQLLVSAKIDLDMKSQDGVEYYKLLGAVWFNPNKRNNDKQSETN